jgi:hypothetical protein
MVKVCEMHRQLEELKRRGMVTVLPIYDGQWRVWHLPVILLSKVMYLMFLHDQPESGTVQYNERGFAVKLMWGGAYPVYFLEIKDMRADDEPFQLQCTSYSLIARILHGIEQMDPDYRPIPTQQPGQHEPLLPTEPGPDCDTPLPRPRSPSSQPPSPSLIPPTPPPVVSDTGETETEAEAETEYDTETDTKIEIDTDIDVVSTSEQVPRVGVGDGSDGVLHCTAA